MPNAITTDDLLRVGVQLLGRLTNPPDTVKAVVATGKKQVKAFNLCTGELTLKEIAQKAKVDRGNLSRAAKRWVEEGVAFWIGTGKEARLLHIYPVREGENRVGNNEPRR